MIKEIQVQIATVRSINRPGLFLMLIGLLLLLVIGAFAYGLASRQPMPAQVVRISQDELEQKYGLRLDLVAVTAAGGFVDVRIRLVDGEKAKALLSEKGNFPALSVGTNVVLQAPEDVRSQEIQFEKDGTMFILYANLGGAVQTGTPVTVRFGDIAVDSIEAR
jgi:hypothetical protein